MFYPKNKPQPTEAVYSFLNRLSPASFSGLYSTQKGRCSFYQVSACHILRDSCLYNCPDYNNSSKYDSIISKHFEIMLFDISHQELDRNN